MSASSAPVPSLRERTKAKRRELIRRTAMRLFAEHGYDGTTIVEIADAAEVAPRTVSMYFPSKADIALSVSNEVAAQLTATLETEPDADFVDAIDQWLTGEISALDAELLSLNTAMFEANPALRALSSSHLSDAARLGGASLVATVGLPADDPMVAIVGGAIGGAIVEYLNDLARASGSPEFHRCFVRYLRALIDAASTGTRPGGRAW